MPDYKYPSINDRDYDLIKKITANLAYIAENGGGGGGGGDVTLAGDNAFTGENSFSDTTDFSGAIESTGENSFSGINSWSGSNVIVYTPMPALEVDFTKQGNSKSLTGDVIMTYSGPPDEGTRTEFAFTADGTNRTVTIPATWSLARGGNITSLLIPANTTLEGWIEYRFGRYQIVNDPVATTGTGSFVLANSPALAGTPTAPTAANGTNTTQVATTAFVQTAVSSSGGGAGGWPYIKSAQAMGSSIKASNLPVSAITTNNNMGDGTVYFMAVYLPEAATITGAMAYMTTQGDYTADNNSKVGLYTYSGGTLTLVASSSDDTALWKSSSGSYIQKAFSSTYAASAGLYFVAFLYNSSAQTTAPALGRSVTLNSASQNAPGTTNSGKLYGTLAAQNDLPASQAMSGITASGTVFWSGIY